MGRGGTVFGLWSKSIWPPLPDNKGWKAMTDIIKAFFDNRADANQAVEQLVAAGISRAAVTILPETESATYSRHDEGPYDTKRDEGGFWASVMKLFSSEDDRGVYAEGMSRGGTLLHVTAEASEVGLVQTILEEHGSVDVNERAETWRQAGWTGRSEPGQFAESAPMAVPATGAIDATSPIAADGPGQRSTADVRRAELEAALDDALLGSPRRSVSATGGSDIQEKMDVIAADGTKVGTVDHLEGRDQIKLAKSTSPDGQHHYVPLSWVDHVDAHVHLTKAAPEVRAHW